MNRIVLVIPCFDEAARLQTDRYLAYLTEREQVDFVFVNDGSRDQTLARLEAMRAKAPERIAVVDQQPNRGKAEAVRVGMREAFSRGPAWAGYWDADLATPLEELDQFLEASAAHPERTILTGARVGLLGREIDRDPLRHYLGRVFATMASLVLRLSVYDTQCGAKLFRSGAATEALFAEPFHVNWTFDVEILSRFATGERAAGREPGDFVYEVPLSRWNDVAGSKVRPQDFFVGLYELWTIRRYAGR